jgi:MoaA/NifB/PqqE/SkfB family radical SAM enzyme
VVVVWRVTQRCNLGCAFCGYDRRLAWARRDADPAQVAAFGGVLADFQGSTGRRVLVSWLGGEPLIWGPLAQLTVTFNRELGLRVSATTNGSTLGALGTRAHVLEHYAELTVSVDAVGRVHDELRAWRGGFARLRRAVSTLAAEKARGGAGPLLRANVVLMRDTVAEFPELCRELSRWGVEEITFNQLGGNDRPEFYPAHRLTIPQVQWLAAEVPRLRDELRQVSVALRGGPRYLERIEHTAAGRALPVADCHPGEEFLFVSEDGVVAPCSFTVAGYGVPLAELRSAGDVAALAGRFRASRAANRLAVCDDCPSTQVFAKF